MRAPESPLERAALALAQDRARSGDKTRLKRLGVVHTPLALVHFALARIAEALQREFGLADGLGSCAIQLLDPALGTGIWLSALLAQQRRAGPHALLGFEADAEVLEAARTLLEPAASARGQRLTLAAGNTLALENPWLPGDHVRVVLGNPPWGARSLSRGLALNDAWLREFHRDHRGEPLAERRSGVLSDDYVRFFRWGLEQARNAPRGAILCLLTNASYLDGPVHRGMRAALARTFDHIELFDLGGGSLRSRAATRDAPLFPVRVPAALSVCVRHGRQHTGTTVSYARLIGSGAEKRALLAGPIRTRSFVPEAPWFRFVPGSQPPAAADGFALDEAFPFQREGIQTNRDELASDVDRERLRARLAQIACGELSLRASRHFDPDHARRTLARALERDPEAETLIGAFAYRPLEPRFYCTLTPLCHRPRAELARASQASQLCLLSARKDLGGQSWNMFAICTGLADSSYLSARSACRTRVFPSHDAQGAANLSERVRDGIAARIARAPTVREVLLYAAGVLGAPGYRSLHAQALKHDYARVPWPRDAAHFLAQLNAGEQFARALAPDLVIQPTLTLRTQRAPSEHVSLRTLRWISPHQLELCSGTEIGARNVRPFRAWVGHHDLVVRAYRRGGSATIAEVHEACERAAMWVEAERAADEAYQPASSVRSAAKDIAGED